MPTLKAKTINDILDFINRNAGQTEKFLKKEKLYSPEQLSALRNNVKTGLEELYSKPTFIRTDDVGLNGMLKDGRLKTQFETGTSKGAVQPDARADLENNVFGYVWNTNPENRPIYGYKGTSGRARQYGNNKITLRKENKGRTTITNDDSMDGSIHEGGTATPIIHGNTSLDYLGSPDALDNYLIDNGRDDLKEHIYSTTAGLKNLKGSDGRGYIEAQIHGGVTPSDFAGILLGDPEKDLNFRKSAADKFGFELRAVDPTDDKLRCFYNCKDPNELTEALRELIESGEYGDRI